MASTVPKRFRDVAELKFRLLAQRIARTLYIAPRTSIPRIEVGRGAAASRRASSAAARHARAGRSSQAAEVPGRSRDPESAPTSSSNPPSVSR